MQMDTTERDRLWVPYRPRRVGLVPIILVAIGWAAIIFGAWIAVGWSGLVIAAGAQLVWAGEALFRGI